MTDEQPTFPTYPIYSSFPTQGDQPAAPPPPPPPPAWGWTPWYAGAAHAPAGPAGPIPPAPPAAPPIPPGWPAPAPSGSPRKGAIGLVGALVVAVVAASAGAGAATGALYLNRHPSQAVAAAPVLPGAPNSPNVTSPPDSIFPFNPSPLNPTDPSTGDGSGGSAASGGGNGSADAATAAKISTGIVDINTRLGYQRAAAAGTGMILTSSGDVLTNNHVVQGATSITATVVTTGKTYTAKVVGTDPTDDIAVIRLTGASGLKTISVGDPSRVSPGDPIIAAGNAGGAGGAPSVVTGTVQATNQSITASDQGGANAEQLSGLIQTNAPIQPGDSGGPLANTSGQVIGMNTAASAGARFQAAASVGFAIPIDHALTVAKQIESGQASDKVLLGLPGFLGVQVADPQSQGGLGLGGGSASGSSATGAAVGGVVSGSPAANAGLKAGDTITAVDGQTVDSAQGLTTVMQRHHPQDRVRIQWTDASGTSHSATVTLATGPAA